MDPEHGCESDNFERVSSHNGGAETEARLYVELNGRGSDNIQNPRAHNFDGSSGTKK